MEVLKASSGDLPALKNSAGAGSEWRAMMSAMDREEGLDSASKRVFRPSSSYGGNIPDKIGYDWKHARRLEMELV